ncbi:TIR domain-containing protein [Haematococcus lacustris]
MISYEWGSQAKALALKLELEQRRYATWLDLDKMLGNTLAAMAEAVENAAVVVVCVSKKYKESQACRTEAEYAFQLKKRIIPVMMELGYRPNGWLGALLGTKLYYDMCDRRAIPDKVTQLERELVDIAHLVQAGNGSCSLGGGPGHFARPVLSAQQARRSSLSAHRSLAPAPAATASLLPGARMQAVNDRRRSLCRTPSAVVPVLATTPRMSSPGQGLPQGAPTPAPVQKLAEHATPVHSLLPQGRAVLRHSIDINDSSHAQGYVRTALPSSGWALGAGSRSLGFATSSAGMRRKSLSMTALLPNTSSLAAAQLHDSDGSPSPGSASRSEFHAWSQEVLGPLHGDGDALVRISEERTSGLGSPGRSNSLSSARHSYAWVPDLSLAWQAAKQRASMQAQAAAMGAANAGGATPPAGLPEASAGPSSSSRSGASCVPAIAQVLSQLPGSQQGIGGSVTQLEGVSNGGAAPAQRSTEEVGPQGSTACSGPPWDSSSCSSQQHCTVAATLPMRPALPVDISSSLLFSSGATPRPAVTAPSATHKHQQQLQLQPTQEGFGSRLGSSEGRDAASASSTPVGSTPRVPSPATSWLGSTRNIKEQQPRVYSHPAKFGSHAPPTQQNSRLHLNSSLRSFCLSPMELDSSTSSSSPSSSDSESEGVRQDTLSALQPTRGSNVAQQGNGANGHNHGSSNAARARRHRSQEQSEPVAFAADENVASQLSKSLDKSLFMGSRRSTGRAHALRRSISSTGVMFNQPPVEAQASRTSSGLVRNASGAQARSRGPGGFIDVRISTSAQRTSTSSAVGRGRTSTGREALEREEEEEGLHAHAEEVEIPWSEVAVEHWTNEDVCNWLQDVELPEMQEIVVQHALDGRALCGLHRMSKLNCLRACVIEDLGVKSPRVLLIFIDELLRLFE